MAKQFADKKRVTSSLSLRCVSSHQHPLLEFPERVSEGGLEFQDAHLCDLSRDAIAFACY